MTLNLLGYGEARNLVIDVLENLRTCPIKTAETFRNAILGDGYFAFNPTIVGSDEERVGVVQDILVHVVSSGRMIDFGHLPNDLIKTTSLRHREAFEAGELQHPYDDWFAVSSWEGGMNGYLISHSLTGQFAKMTCIELYGVALPGKPPVVLVYDMVGIEPKEGDTKLHPCPLTIPHSKEQDSLRAANSLDPLVTFLSLLADASIPVVDRLPPEKLNRARMKAGKRPIPPHHEVQTRDYVSMLQHAKPAKANGGGHHASPIAHWRRSHRRTMASGKVVAVRSAHVNWRDPAELHRIFYRVPHIS